MDSFERLQEAKRRGPTMHTLTTGPLHRLGERIWNLAERAGWHDESDTFHSYLSAIASEVGEAHNAFRDRGLHRAEVSRVIGYDHVTGEPISENPKPEGVGPELADIIIRTAHLARFLGIDLDYEVEKKEEYLTVREERKREFDN